MSRKYAASMVALALLGFLGTQGIVGNGTSHSAALAVATSTAVLFETGVTPVATRSIPTAPASSTPGKGTMPTAVATESHTVTPTPTAVIVATPTATSTETPRPLIAPTSPPVVLGSPTPTPTLTSATYGSLDHLILYTNGVQMALVNASGTGKTGLSFLSANSGKLPRFSGGWQYLYYNNGFWLGDIYGHQRSLIPPVTPGEEVYDAVPSPDGQYIAWQMVTAATIAGNVVNTGASRIVLSDATGGNARTLLQQPAGTSLGDIPLLYGWKAGKPPTLLVQTNYAIPSMLGLHKGLEEFDPTILDMVNDYLPPLGEHQMPQGEVLGVSASGSTIIYASADARLPSGEGPFPTNIVAVTSAQRHSTIIDTALSHSDKATRTLPAPRAYIFARQAFVSPDDNRVAYTRLDILYPNRTDRPYVRPVACLANMDGSGKVSFGPDERVMGWVNGHTVLVRRENTRTNGLYAVDLTSGHTTRILLGSGLTVDGIIP